MSEITLNTTDLKRSESNVRAGHSKEDIYTMATSIKNRGIINPPSVAKNGDGRYEIVAGQLRVAGAIAAGLKKIRCIDVTELTPEQRVDISLSENVHRRAMSEIELFRAFDKLFRSGMPVEQIAARFDKSEREVQQLLAIGGLPKKILDAAERDEIAGRTLQALAVAPKGEVRRYLKLKISDRPRDWEIQEWLAGADGMFMAKHGIFDSALYTGGTFTDLFADEDEVWLTDGSMFMELQTAAIDAKLEDFKKKGWKCEQVDYWQSWAYNKTAKKKGGMVIYSRDPRSGAVEFHVGYKRQGKSGAAPKPTKGKGEKAVAKPEVSQEFHAYMTEVRHDAVCRHMLDDRTAGLVGTIVILVKQMDNVSLQNQGSRVKNEAMIKSMNSGSNALVVKDDFREMMEELGIKGKHTWDISTANLTKKLLEYTPATLERFIVTIIARNWTLNSDGKDSDALGKALGLSQVNIWEADAAFWEGIKNKDTLIKIAKENKITINSKATTKVIRAVVADKMADGWRPSWLKF